MANVKNNMTLGDRLRARVELGAAQATIISEWESKQDRDLILRLLDYNMPRLEQCLAKTDANKNYWHHCHITTPLSCSRLRKAINMKDVAFATATLGPHGLFYISDDIGVPTPMLSQYKSKHRCGMFLSLNGYHGGGGGDV